jgi:hypothetical protein
VNEGHRAGAYIRPRTWAVRTQVTFDLVEEDTQGSIEGFAVRCCLESSPHAFGSYKGTVLPGEGSRGNCSGGSKEWRCHVCRRAKASLSDAESSQSAAQLQLEGFRGADQSELRGVLASIGIIKGKPFEPTEKQQELLPKAVRTAPKMIMANRQLGRPDGQNRYY